MLRRQQITRAGDFEELGVGAATRGENIGQQCSTSRRMNAPPTAAVTSRSGWWIAYVNAIDLSPGEGRGDTQPRLYGCERAGGLGSKTRN
jgi:hypothetical protein